MWVAVGVERGATTPHQDRDVRLVSKRKDHGGGQGSRADDGHHVLGLYFHVGCGHSVARVARVVLHDKVDVVTKHAAVRVDDVESECRSHDHALADIGAHPRHGADEPKVDGPAAG